MPHNLQRKEACMNFPNSDLNEDVFPGNCYYGSDEKSMRRNLIGSPIITISAQKCSNPISNFFNPDPSTNQLLLNSRPATSDHKLNRRHNFDYKMERPSTSKPYQSNFRRIRTRMLSQKEYNQLQYSEKKSIKEAKRTIDKPISQYSDFAQRVSLRSEKKQVFIDRNVQIKVFDENESQEVSKEQNEEQVFEDHQTDPNEVEDLKAPPSIKKHRVKKKKIKDADYYISDFNAKTTVEDQRERAHFKNNAEAIFLRVYDVIQCPPINRCLECFGFGIYHTSIQIYGHEYYYGGHESEITGIVETDIGK